MKFVLRYRPEVVADLVTGRRWYEERSGGFKSLARDQSLAVVAIDDYSCGNSGTKSKGGTVVMRCRNSRGRTHISSVQGFGCEQLEDSDR